MTLKLKNSKTFTLLHSKIVLYTLSFYGPSASCLIKISYCVLFLNKKKMKFPSFEHLWHLAFSYFLFEFVNFFD